MRARRLSELRPRTVWDVLDDAFDLYRERFALFAGIAAVALVPGYLLLSPWMTELTLAASGRTPQAGGDQMEKILVAAALSSLILGIAYVLYGGATAAAVDGHLAGRTTGLAGAYRRVLARSLSLFAAAALVLLLSVAAAVVTLCFFGLGALAVLVLYFFVPQAVMLEANGPLRAGKRSRDLVTGDAGKVLGLILLLSLLSTFLLLGISSVAEMLLAAAPGSGDLAARETRNALVSQGIQSVLSVLLAPLAPIAATLLYYDMRVRREGLDMEAQAAAIGYPLAADPFGGIPSEVARRLAAQQAARAAQQSMRAQPPPSPPGAMRPQ